jgi:hypothetical protein
VEYSIRNIAGKIAVNPLSTANAGRLEQAHPIMKNTGTHTVCHGRRFDAFLRPQETTQTVIKMARNERRHKQEMAKVAIGTIL